VTHQSQLRQPVSRAREALQPLRALWATLLGGVLIASTGLIASVPGSAGAASPNDYLCYVEGSGQTALTGSTYATPLEVELSTTSCASPTPDTTSGLTVSFSVSGGGGPSVTFSPSSPITATGGFASTTPTADDVSGPVSVRATSSASEQSVTFSLENEGAPASITANDGSYQSTPLDTAFPLNLSVTVNDSSGNPITGAEVSYVAPSSGAGGVFSSNDATSVLVVTGDSGVAVAPSFVANGIAGGYVVKAYVDGTALVASFALVNEAANPLTVGSVSPPLINQGAGDLELAVTGSGFEDGLLAGFDSPQIKITATTFVNATTIDLQVTIPASLPTGAYSLTVTNPGGAAATAPEALIVAPELRLPAPAAFFVTFSGGNATLSARARSQLTSYADHLLSGASVRVVGYARANASLARTRAARVGTFLKALTLDLHVSVSEVTSAAANRAEVITTANN